MSFCEKKKSFLWKINKAAFSLTRLEVNIKRL